MVKGTSMQTDLKILFLGNSSNPKCKAALDYCAGLFPDTFGIFDGDRDSILKYLSVSKVDIILSYLSKCILTPEILRHPTMYSINFHPGPPNYRGFAPYSFALYNDEKQYGVTCHKISDKIDNGNIIRTSWFPVMPQDTVDTLFDRTQETLLQLFIRTIDELKITGTVTESGEQWCGNLHTKKQCDAMMELNFTMSKDEINKRIRAFNFRNFNPYFMVHGFKFKYSK